MNDLDNIKCDVVIYTPTTVLKYENVTLTEHSKGTESQRTMWVNFVDVDEDAFSFVGLPYLIRARSNEDVSPDA